LQYATLDEPRSERFYRRYAAIYGETDKLKGRSMSARLRPGGFMKKLLLVLCSILLVAAVAEAVDSFLGTWTLNIAKSKYDPGPAPKSQTTVLEGIPDGQVRERGERVNADGSRTQWEWTAKFDGKDYPVKGDPDRDTVSLKKIDDNTLEVTNKKSGKVTNTMKIVVAKDGKSRTNEASFTNAKGVKVHNVMFFDRE
jgi:hypothetical protein